MADGAAVLLHRMIDEQAAAERPERLACASHRRVVEADVAADAAVGCPELRQVDLANLDLEGPAELPLLLVFGLQQHLAIRSLLIAPLAHEVFADHGGDEEQERHA